MSAILLETRAARQASAIGVSERTTDCGER